MLRWSAESFSGNRSMIHFTWSSGVSARSSRGFDLSLNFPRCTANCVPVTLSGRVTASSPVSFSASSSCRVASLAPASPW